MLGGRGGVGARQLSEVPPELVGGGRQLLDGGDAEGTEPAVCLAPLTSAPPAAADEAASGVQAREEPQEEPPPQLLQAPVAPSTTTEPTAAPSEEAEFEV